MIDVKDITPTLDPNLILDLLGEGVFGVDSSGRCTFMNPAACRKLGFSEGAPIGEDMHQICAGDKTEQAHDPASCLLCQAITGFEVHSGEGQMFIRADQTELQTTYKCSPIITDEKPDGAIVVFRSITRRQAVAQELNKAQERFSQSQKFANIGTWDWNVQTGDLYWTKTIGPLFGYKEGELETSYENFLAAIHPDDRDSVQAAVNTCIEAGVEYNIEHRVVWPDGTVRWLHECGDVVRADDGSPINMLGVVQDITKRKELEAQLIQSSKMATLGEMATGVAHELNQPLNVIRMAAANSRAKLEKDGADAAYLLRKLDRIEEQIARAAEITDHMRVFGRKSSGGLAPIKLGEVVRNCIVLVGEPLRHAEISLINNIPDDAPMVMGHRIQLEQVLLNLINNAKDALLSRGVHAPWIRLDLEQDEHAGTTSITVADNGEGIDENILNRVFEPFFTTKDVGEGTGLGLSISFGIVESMGGEIHADNTQDGALFTVILPASKTAELNPE